MTLEACFACLWAIVNAANLIIKELCSKGFVNWGITVMLQMAYKRYWWNWRVLRCLAYHPPSSSNLTAGVIKLHLWGETVLKAGAKTHSLLHVFIHSSIYSPIHSTSTSILMLETLLCPLMDRTVLKGRMLNLTQPFPHYSC